MNLIQAICDLIAEKKRAFIEYENHTQSILSCELEEIEAHVQRRQELVEQVQEADRKLEELCRSNPIDGSLMLQAIQNKCDRAELPPQQLCIFDAAQEVFSVINRILNIETQASDRIHREQDALLQKIRETNNGTPAQAAKYYRNAGMVGGERTILHEKYNKA